MKRKLKESITSESLKTPPRPVRRVIGLDNHPDSFTAAALRGSDPQTAKVEAIFDCIAQEEFEPWLLKHTSEDDLIVIEASANTFEAVRVAEAHGRHSEVLESQHCAKLSKSYCNTDKISAIKLARLYLSGLAKNVWVPDERTLLRREVFYAHAQAVRESTRERQYLRAFLNKHRIRLSKGFRFTAPAAAGKILAMREWERTQRLIITQHCDALHCAELRRKQFRQEMARDIVSHPELLRLIRLCGLRHITVYALAAFIGDITRFATPKKLAAYIGVNPSVDCSGAGHGSTALRGHGCAALRALMVQAAQAIMRTHNHKLAQWGCKIAFRRGHNRAVIGVARKLTTAVWYCLSGMFTELEEVPANIAAKLGLLLNELEGIIDELKGRETLAGYRQRLLESLCTSHSMVFKPAS